MNKLVSLLFCVLIATAPLAGCLDDEIDPAEGIDLPVNDPSFDETNGTNNSNGTGTPIDTNNGTNNTGNNNTGNNNSGNNNTGNNNTGNNNTGNNNTGNNNTGNNNTGNNNTGSNNTGNNTIGNNTNTGNNTGNNATGNNTNNGNNTTGNSTSGNTTGGNVTGGNTTECGGNITGTFAYSFTAFDYTNHPDYTNLGGIEINCDLNVLYGYAWDEINLEEVFVSIDPSTGLVSYLATIPTIEMVAHSSTYDEGEYFAVMRDVQGVVNLIQVSTLNGNLVSVTPFDYTNAPDLDQVGGIEYDAVNDVIYGYAFDSTNDDAVSVSIEPSTGLITELGVISAGPTSVTALSTTFDGTNYYIGIRDSQSERWLGLVSVTGTFGVTLSELSNPTSANILSSVAGFEVESNTGLVYGYGWDSSNNEEIFVEYDPVTGTMTSIGVLTGITLTTTTATYFTGNFYAIMADSSKTQYLVHIQF